MYDNQSGSNVVSQPSSPPSDPVPQNPNPPDQPGSPPNAPRPNAPLPNAQQPPAQSVSPQQQNAPSPTGEPAQQSQPASAPVSPPPMQPASVGPPPAPPSPQISEEEQRAEFRKNAALSIAQRKKSMKASPEEVRHVLVENEYNEEEVEYAMSKAYPEGELPEFEHPDTKTKYGFFNKIIDVMFKPSDFFDAIRDDKSFKSVIMYLVILGTVAVILGFIFELILGGVTAETFFIQSYPADPALTSTVGGLSLLSIVCSVGLIPISVALLVLGMFITAGIYHLMALVFQSKEPYIQTYKALVYSQTPSLLFSAFASIPYISCISIVFSIWGFVLTVIGMKKLHNLSTGQAIGVVAIPLVVIGGCIIAAVFLIVVPLAVTIE